MSLLFEPRDINFDALLRQKYGKEYTQQHKWKYYHLFTLLLRKHLYRKNKSRYNGWYAVSSATLRSLYGRTGKREAVKWVHNLIREDFKAWGVVLHHTEQVVEKKRISRYKILDERLLAGFRLVDTVVPRRHAPPHPAQIKYKDIHGLIQRTAGRLKVDNIGALAFIEKSFADSLPLADKPIDWKETNEGRWHLFRHRIVDVSVYSRWLWHLHKLERGSYGFKVDTGNTNRVFYLLTQIPRHLRQFVLLEGKRMVEVDVTACQPLLFTALVLKYCHQQGIHLIPKDVLDWKKLCEESDPHKSLYPTLYKLMAGENLRLDSDLTYNPATGTPQRIRGYTKLFKTEFFAKIFFDEDKNTKMRAVFAKTYPTVSAAITHYKQGGYKSLSLALQKMEADIIIGTVCPRLYDQNIKVLPVHDALYTHEEHANIVAEEIKRAFLEIGLNAQVKINY